MLKYSVDCLIFKHLKKIKMTQTHNKSLGLSLFLVLCCNFLIGQNVCITPPNDIVWNCGEEDWLYVYTQTDDVIVHFCNDPNNILSQQIELVVDIETLNCSDSSSPNVVSRIHRTFITSAPGQTSECGTWIECASQTIDVVDFEAPEFTEFPNDTLINCHEWDLLDYLISGLFQVDFNDECGIVDQTIDLDTIIGYCAAEREFQWEFTLVDQCSNTRIDTHFVTVVDTIGPTIGFIPPQDLAIPFKCKDLVVWPILDASDLCSSINDVEWGEIEEEELSCTNHWALSRWAYAEDDCGNKDSTQYFIEVLDDVAPVLTYIPVGYIKNCEETPEFELPTAEDNCSGEVTIEVETEFIYGECPQNYIIHRTFIATDNCGNETTADQEIIVEDVESPQLSIPDDYTIECSAEIVYENAVVSDNCDDDPDLFVEIDVVDVASSGTYTIERTFIVTDACGNSSTGMQTIDVEDTNPPYFTSFPDDIVIPCGEDYPEEGVEFEDACDPNPNLGDLNVDENWEDCANESVVYRTFVIEDDAGNTYSQTQTITFLDEAPPYFISFPNNVEVACASNIEYLMPEFDDDCSSDGMDMNVSESIVDQICEDHFDLVRSFTITDACGLSTTLTQTIEVRDNTAPVLETTLDSLYFYCSYNMPDCDETFNELEFEDECGSNTIIYNCEDVVFEGDCEEQACTIERIYTWEDGCGNSASASHFIRVEETVFDPTFPTGITPNGDGANDDYVILDIGPLIDPGVGAPCDWIPDTYFKVANRWGQIVYEETDYRNDWNGVDNGGEPLAPGTYFVIFEVMGKAYSTFVDLRR